MVLLAALVIPHLVWAQQLLVDLRPEHNSYGRNPTLVLWRGVDGAPSSHNRSDCSSFISALWRRAYGYGPDEMRQWLGDSAPRAIDYHAAIAAANRFQRIERIADLQPGDLLATRYARSRPGATGHVMVAAARPMAVDACLQARCVFRLEVIDSSRSGHGPADTRQGKGGVGKGVIQLQTSRDGQLQAYRWSERSSSRWRFPPEESLRVGRFKWQVPRDGG
jgi:cell wall-associated NlpC family hydrolase